MSIQPLPELFVKPVDGSDDAFAFRYDFLLEGKAVEDATPQIITELDDGDLLIEGYAAVFDGIDRQDENFMPGAFQRGIKSFLGGQASLNFHHKNDHGIGKVLDLQEEEGKGLRMKARVDFQPESSPLRYIYNAIKKGTYNALSVGGFFKRKLTEAGYRIADMDFTEISVTPVPVHPGTNFAVVAGKALEDGDVVDKRTELGDDVLKNLSDAVDAAAGVFSRIEEFKALPNTHDPKDARFAKTLLTVIAESRQIASAGRDDANDSALVKVADEIETRAAEWEAAIHQIAAQVGPLPSTPY